MKKFLGLGILGLCFLIAVGLFASGIWGVSAYNELVRRNERVATAFAQVENQMQRRMDLIPNLVETVKGFAAQEEQLFTKLAQARAEFASASTIQGKIRGMGAVNGQLSQILALSENYPEMKSDRNFTALMDELTGTENRLAVERKRFNEAVEAYNVYRKSFPAGLVAELCRFREHQRFQAQAGAAQAPKVSFGS